MNWVEECLVETWGGKHDDDTLQAARDGYRAAESALAVPPPEAVYSRCVAAMKIDGVVGIEDILAVHPTFDVNWQNIKGRTLLHEAARLGLSDIAAWLAARCDVDLPANDGGTPCHHACFRGHEEVARILVAQGASRIARNVHGEDPSAAAKSGGHNILDAAIRSSAFARPKPIQHEFEKRPRESCENHGANGSRRESYGASYTPNHEYEQLLEVALKRKDAAVTKALEQAQRQVLLKRKRARERVINELASGIVRPWDDIIQRPNGSGLGYVLPPGGRHRLGSLSVAARRAQTAVHTKCRFDSISKATMLQNASAPSENLRIADKPRMTRRVPGPILNTSCILSHSRLLKGEHPNVSLAACERRSS